MPIGSGNSIIQQLSAMSSFFEPKKLHTLAKAGVFKGIFFALGLSFVLATALSTYLGQLLMPASETGKGKSSVATAGKRPIQALVEGEPASVNQADVKVILERNIFNSEGELGDEPVKEGGKSRHLEAGEAVKSNLPLKLSGVIFGGTPFNGLAMIEDTEKRRINSFIVGDIIVNRVKLLEVYDDRIIIDNEGQREFIEVDKAPPLERRRGKGGTTPARDISSGPTPIAEGPPPENYKEEGFERKGSAIQISDTFKRDLLGPKMSKVLQDAKAVPNMVGGEIRGFRLERVRENSIYQKAGLQNGDVIEEINGVPLRDAAGAIRLLQSLRNEKEIEVRFNRSGSSQNMNISIQ